MWKRGEIAPKEQFLLFSTIFSMSLTSGVKLHIHLLNVVVRFIVFLTSATLIFRGTDSSKCFRESLGIRESTVCRKRKTERKERNKKIFVLLINVGFAFD